jgi:S-DNA-T family DNA segregation ATPase FtsK/SpoIIIE
LTVSRSGSVTAADLGSRNGTWRGGEPVQGDVAIGPGEVLRLGAVQIVARKARRDDRPRRGAWCAPGLAGVVPFNRPPRASLPRPAGAIELPEPPKPAAGRGTFSVVSVIAPLVMAAVMVQVLGNPAFALFALLSPVVLIGTTVEQRRRHARSSRREAARYRSDLTALATTLAACCAAERERRQRLLPDLAEVVRRAQQPSVHLWERRPGHGDWLRLRAGLGNLAWLPSLVEPRGARTDELETTLANSGCVRDAAVEIDLSDGGVVGIIGPRVAALAVARSLLVQAAVHHGPADLSVLVLVRSAALAEWDWAKWLPHTRSTDGGGRLLAAGSALANAMAEGLLASARGSHSPTVLAVVDDEALLEGRRAPVRALLGGKGGSAGGRVAGIVIAPSADRLPAMCGTIVELCGPDGDARVHRPFEDDDTGARPMLAAGMADDIARSAARALARYDDPEVDVPGSGLPDLVPLLPLLEIEGLAQRWLTAGNDPAPQATIGCSVDDVCVVDLARDGPHALVAGTTGAGKSELLRTLVAGLAASSSPEHLTFLLIDFKGGSAFDACARLPHTVGLVTDLDEHLAERALRCLEAELRHRERTLRAWGASDLGDFRAAGSETREPLPRLVVVVDEFATLKAELPDFIDALVGIAQRGRSLGVHLVLATQRPAGAVSENIKANTSLRIALRVQDGSDSTDVIGVPLAASLPRQRPGRAIVRFGPTELVPIQTALATTPAAADHPAPLVLVPFVFGSADAAQQAPAVAPRTELDVFVDAAIAAHAASGHALPRRPCPDPLPELVTLEDLTGAAAATPWAVPFALADDPDNQRRDVHRWRPVDGNLLLWGIGGSGTSTALATIGLALVAAADDAHLYVLAAGGGELIALRDLPQCGAVIGAGERERQARLLRMLRTELQRRRADGGAPRPAIVVLLDGYAAFAAEHSDVAGLTVIDDLARVFADGPEVGIHMAVAADRVGAVPSALASLAQQRLLFRSADQHDFAMAGVSRHSLPTFCPGRAIDSVTGRVVQVARPATSLADAVASVRDSAVAGRRAPAAVGSLPTVVRVSELPSASLAARPWVIPIGIGERDLAVAGFTLFDGEHALIAGPGRSGRSRALCVIAETCRDALVVTVAGPRSPLRADHGPSAAHLAVADVLAHRGPALLLVDDAELVDDVTGALGALIEGRHPNGHRPDIAVIAGGRADGLRAAYTHWTRGLRRSKVGLLLQPNVDLDGELLGQPLPRRAPVALTPGRGWLVGGSDSQVVQVAGLP